MSPPVHPQRRRAVQAALVTGGASFLGSAICRRLAAEGYAVAVHYARGAERARRLVREIERSGGRAVALRADFERPARAAALVREAVRFFGGLDLLVNNASLFFPTPGLRPDPRAFDRLFRVNATTPCLLALEAAPHLARRRGAVVNLTDGYVVRPAFLPDHPAYVASKAALEALTRLLARRLAPKVRVCAVAPGALKTGGLGARRRRKILERTALRRLGSADDAARAVCFLAREPFLTGQTIAVDGGRFL